MELSELTIKEYSDALEAKKSVPGGGSALAVVLELACSLGIMCANFTVDKPKYEDVQEETKNIIKELQEIKAFAHTYIDEDAKAYNAVMAAYKSRDEEEISKASLYGSQVPLNLYKLTKRAEDLCRRMYEIGNKNLISDAKIGYTLCLSIYPGCVDNFNCNIAGVKDDVLREKLIQELTDLEK